MTAPSTITLSDGSTVVTVSRLKWRALGKLAKILAPTLYRLRSDPTANLAAIVADSGEAATLLIASVTGLPAAEVDELDSLDAVKLLAAALDVNKPDEIMEAIASLITSVTGSLTEPKKTA